MSDYPVTSGKSKGLFLTFEGMCAIVRPKLQTDPVRIGLLAGHKHLATLKLHRDGADPAASWEPTTADDDYFSYALKGLHITFKAENADPIRHKYTDINYDCPKDENWTDLGWALDVRKDLRQAGDLHDKWWTKPEHVDTVFELDKGWLEYKFDGDEPIQFEKDPVMWLLPDGTKRVFKQTVRYRLSADNIVIEARSLGGDGNPKTIPLAKDPEGKALLVYAGAKHFPLGPKKERIKPEKPLEEAKAYYHLLVNPPLPENQAVPTALDPEEDCDEQATPDCSCCPPAVY